MAFGIDPQKPGSPQESASLLATPIWSEVRSEQSRQQLLGATPTPRNSGIVNERGFTTMNSVYRLESYVLHFEETNHEKSKRVTRSVRGQFPEAETKTGISVENLS